MTLIATPKATNANSLATVAQADIYHSGRLHNAEWTSATEDNKGKALIMATTGLMIPVYKGVKTLAAQSLKHPRTGLYDDDGNSIDSDIIAQQMINAVSEYAFLLLIKDSTREGGDKGVNKIKVGPIDLDFNALDRAKSIPPAVTDMIKQWIINFNTVGVARG